MRLCRDFCAADLPYNVHNHHWDSVGHPWIRASSHDASHAPGWTVLLCVRPSPHVYALSLNEITISTVLAFMLLAAVMAVSTHVSPVYQAAFAIPTIAIESNMACTIFRDMVMRSPDVDQNGSLPLTEACTTAVSGFELDTVLEPLSMNTEQSRFGIADCYVRN